MKILKTYFFNKKAKNKELQWLNRLAVILLSTCCLLMYSGCRKLVDVEAPVTNITSEVVFNSDATAIAVMNKLYSDMSAFGFPEATAVTANVWTALSGDELAVWDGASDATIVATYQNNLKFRSPEFWTRTYNQIYICNSVIEGATDSDKLSPEVKNQLLGEAKFMRAYLYFYLVNIYGDSPLALTTDFKINSLLRRSPINEVYSQIVSDLVESESLLQNDYRDGSLRGVSQERVRPNRSAAAALLARVYLYTQDWEQAKAKASAVIGRTDLYDVQHVPLNEVFLANSREAIWQLQPVNDVITNTNDGRLFIIPATGPNDENPVFLSDSLTLSFEGSDLRRKAWVDSVIVKISDATPTSPEILKTYYFAHKYKENSPLAPVTEYTMMLRLAEMYLVRAEASLKLGQLQEAKDDVNILRRRAGLGDITSNDPQQLLNLILRERRHELFIEGAHRWFDLKRTNEVDAVMKNMTPLKGGTWSSNWRLYPIPSGESLKNRNISQNQGY
ncbi:RagB/SusD family nutrient uptake outer membrane protein [Pedobacter sp. JY14-1]|uniref:RagB/SusD family nutrient uptake outer membrane protein n=1 Tax=Pedobacter sp. JY14-1 TaxID=3034151 RepID=UPI0023E1DB32|nr:RagB/SusD family nutrient uptake outer membrane protein [Pedobacter sp. JY14-1]